jgi:hypothetical protein
LQCSAAVASAVLPETNPEAAAAIPEVAAAIPEVALLPVRDLTLGEREVVEAKITKVKRSEKFEAKISEKKRKKRSEIL